MTSRRPPNGLFGEWVRFVSQVTSILLGVASLIVVPWLVSVENRLDDAALFQKETTANRYTLVDAGRDRDRQDAAHRELRGDMESRLIREVAALNERLATIEGLLREALKR